MVFLANESFYIGLMLILGSMFAFFVIVRYIRKSRVKIEDTLFWMLFSFLLIVLSFFPDLAINFSSMMGIASPVNLVYLIVIFILFVKLFSVSMSLSKTQVRTEEIAQQLAIEKKKIEDLKAELKQNKKDESK